MSFFSNLFFKKQENKEEAILNAGLDMAMEFGEDFRKPIQERLARKYSDLSPEQLDHYNSECTTAMHAGNQFVNDLLENLSGSGRTIPEPQLKSQLKSFMTPRYTWINQDNLDRLYSQSCYFAFKNGYDSGIGS